MIGSNRKIELTKKMFLEGNIASIKELENFDMPIGINIKVNSPVEIAISTFAKLIIVKNG
ncbi:MAG: XdhC/CoxF family protein [Maribacter sp.]|nr:XdhC/CoxF family protein [Maribacter sp.]